jgi:ArsR family transcriptional regulator
MLAASSSTHALARVFRALADETRLQMLGLLLEESELCVCHIERTLGISQSKASRHLRYLLNAGLLQDRRQGVWTHYRLADAMGPERQLILEAVRQALDPALVADLQARLEGTVGSAAVGPPGADCPPPKN